MKTETAIDIKEIIRDLVDGLDMKHIDVNRLVCYRSFKTTTNAIARIWSLPNLWQKALDVKAHYIIEVVSENYDHLNQTDKEKTILHELCHIPKNFSGSVLNHKRSVFDGKGGHKKVMINQKSVDKLYKDYLRARDLVQ
ncbi:MAG: metallopeptidase [Nanoarchaeota archaeon]|nr:metallopeptidase [Nanoarchaeota archaeon]